MAALQAKVGDANLRRKIALEGHRFTPGEALAAGLVDRIVPGDSAEAVLRTARELAESVDSLPMQGAWGLIKVDFVICESLQICMTDDGFQRRICTEM